MVILQEQYNVGLVRWMSPWTVVLCYGLSLFVPLWLFCSLYLKRLVVQMIPEVFTGLV
jgi:hypothetical protein